MSESFDILRKIIDRTKFTREAFVEKNVPDKFSNIKILPFFGDISSEFILSTLLLHRLLNRDSYYVMLSWPGHSGLFPFINEYWSISDEGELLDLERRRLGFDNSKSNVYEKILYRFFDEVLYIKDLISPYYNNGFTKRYFEEHKDIQYKLPTIPSVNLVWKNTDKIQAKKIFIHPVKYVRKWEFNKQELLLVEEKFWEVLIEKLLEQGYYPVVWQGPGTHDLSPKYFKECLFTTEKNIMAIMGVMRACDCVLDVFSGISRYAMIARTPHLIVDERQRYYQTNDFIIDDLCSGLVQKSIMYSFTPLVTADSMNTFAQGIINKLQIFLNSTDNYNAPSSIEQTKFLNYDQVRNNQMKRMGISFFVPPKLEKNKM